MTRILLLCLLLSSSVFSSTTDDCIQMAKIVTISKDKKSIMLALGKKREFYPGKEIIIFDTKTAFRLRAIESTRDYTLFSLTEKRTKLPYNKNDFINLSCKSQISF